MWWSKIYDCLDVAHLFPPILCQLPSSNLSLIVPKISFVTAGSGVTKTIKYRVSSHRHRFNEKTCFLSRLAVDFGC